VCCLWLWPGRAQAKGLHDTFGPRGPSLGALVLLALSFSLACTGFLYLLRVLVACAVTSFADTAHVPAVSRTSRSSRASAGTTIPIRADID